jgi:class 3 adenylate cyclase
MTNSETAGDSLSLSYEHLSALVDLAPELAEDTALRSLLDRVLARAVALTSSTGGSVYLYDDRRRKLYVAHAVGPAAPVVLAKYGASGDGIPIVGSKAGGVFVSGTSAVVNTVEDDPEHYKAVDAATARITESMIAVPLMVAGDRIGVVQLVNKIGGPYSVYDAALLARFSGLAAVAVRNARLLGDLAAQVGVYGLAPDAVDAATLRRLLNAPAQNERVSVLFADMRGYSRLEQTLRSPELLQSRLNEYLTMLASAVLEQAGLVNKFLGDGVMALFRGPDHELRAVKCAQSMIDRFGPMRERWREAINESIGFLDIGIGVATDTVTLCTVGSDVVREFTAVGRAVNLASTLVHTARNGLRLLVDRQTFRSARAMIEKWKEPFKVQIQSVGESGPDYEVYQIELVKSDGLPAFPAASPPIDVAAPPRQQVFISYSHEDRDWLDQLHAHLRPFLKRDDFELWDDTRITAGQMWRAELESALSRAGAAVLLVSPQFLSSEFIDRHELPPIFEAARKRGLRVFWLPVSASAYDETEIANFQALHDPRIPLDQVSPAERNAVLVKACRQIAGALRRDN